MVFKVENEVSHQLLRASPMHPKKEPLGGRKMRGVVINTYFVFISSLFRVVFCGRSFHVCVVVSLFSYSSQSCLSIVFLVSFFNFCRFGS